MLDQTKIAAVCAPEAPSTVLLRYLVVLSLQTSLSARERNITGTDPHDRGVLKSYV